MLTEEDMANLESHKLYDILEKNLADQEFAPVYVFFGEEEYLIHQAVKVLRSYCLHNLPADFNEIQFHSDVSADRLRQEVETLPVMSPRRFVWVRDAQDFSDRFWEDISSLLKDPVNSTVLVFTAQKLDKRKKSFKWLSDFSMMVEFRKPFENQLPGWIARIGSSYDLQLQAPVISYLQEAIGNHLQELDSEIQKLSQYVKTVPGRNDVSLEEAQVIVRPRPQDNVFELVDTLANADQVQSLIQLAQLLQRGQSEVGIVQLLARHFRILMRLQAGQDQGLTGSAKLAAYAQVPPFFLGKYLAQLPNWTGRRLEQCLSVLADTDYALKSSPLSAHIWLENLILKLVQIARHGQGRNSPAGASDGLHLLRR
jgi:DNA polymerase-3 subunit delta